MSIETRFDIPLIASLALREKQVQQNYRPIIAVHKWFARRPGTLFRGLILSEFDERPLCESFFSSHDIAGHTVADPFMGGGTPLVEANRVGCDTLGWDVNPMSAWIVREEIEHIDLNLYRRAAGALLTELRQAVGHLYVTDCPCFGDRNVPVKYFLWVKVLPCVECGHNIDLFPGYLLADDTRHPRHVMVCAACGDLNEVQNPQDPGKCGGCGERLVLQGPAKRNRCRCRLCNAVNSYPRAGEGPLGHRLFAIEYHNPGRRALHQGRFFKKPDEADLKRVAQAARQWASISPRYVPEDEIPGGDESDRLHRWGYRRYRELFNERQLLGLELSCQHISRVGDERVRRALATNLSDLLRYQNMLCRYDSMALKSLDIFSVHGFPVGLVECESNLPGIMNSAGANVGSGGWCNIIEKYAKAKQYCDAPFEVRHERGRKVIVPIHGEWIGERLNGSRSRQVAIRCADSGALQLQPESLDAVFTDPPYFGNVQYAELMDFCYVWLRKIAPGQPEGFDRPSTRSRFELTGNETQSKGLSHFTEGLSAVYQSMAKALKPGAPLAFTFHHNMLSTYHAVGVAILDAGLTCTASIPCPAEMGGSIHIHGTGSSILDTVFVCRAHGHVRRSQAEWSPEHLLEAVRRDLEMLRQGGVKPRPGDIRCLVFGHLTRFAVWRLRKTWNPAIPVHERLGVFAARVAAFGNPEQFIAQLPETPGAAHSLFASPVTGDRV